MKVFDLNFLDVFGQQFRFVCERMEMMNCEGGYAFYRGRRRGEAARVLNGLIHVCTAGISSF